MKNNLQFTLALLSLFIPIFSCVTQYDKTSDTISQSDSGKSLLEQKKEARKIFAAAHREFFQGVDSIENSLLRDFHINRDQFGTKEKIIAAAWQAYYTDNNDHLIRLLRENGLYDKMQLLIKKYELEQKQQVLNQQSPALKERKVEPSFFNQFVDGDLFLCYGGSNSIAVILDVIIPGHWKHAGIMDKATAPNSSYCVLTASNNTNIPNGSAVGRVGYESRSKWVGEKAVIALRVKGRTDANSRAAINYGRKYIGKPFNFITSRESDSDFYCSKLVWRAWKSQGKDLEYNTWFYWKGVWVTPQDIYDDSDTYYIAGDKD